MTDECVILFRYSNGRVGFISDAEDETEIAVFRNRDDAIEAADHTTACKAFPFQIVDLDEL